MPSRSAVAATGTRRRGGGVTAVRPAAGGRPAAGVTAVGADAVDAVTPGCSAWANWASVAWRSAATGARARVIARSTSSGTLGRTWRTRGISPLKRLAITAWAVAPVNGASPASIS